MTESTTETKQQQDDRATKLRKAYTNAAALLREKHRDEFDKFYADEAAKLGVDYTPKPSAEQRAEQQIDSILAEYPHLRERLLAVAEPETVRAGSPEPERPQSGPQAI